MDTFTERGLWTMYVGVGFLNWLDPKDGKPVETPLLLQPVEFGRNSLSEPRRQLSSGRSSTASHGDSRVHR